MSFWHLYQIFSLYIPYSQSWLWHWKWIWKFNLPAKQKTCWPMLIIKHLLPANNQLFWLLTLNSIHDHLNYITKNCIPAQSFSLQRVQLKEMFFWKALRWCVGGREGMLAFQKGQPRRARVNSRRPAGSKCFIVRFHLKLLNAHRNTEHCLFPEEPSREREA